MNKYYLILIIFLTTLSQGQVYCYQPLPMTEREATMFYRELQSQLVEDENQIIEHLRKPRIFEQSKLQVRTDVLKTKQILYKNFYNTESVQSPLVRRKLVEIFKKEIIEAHDLTELQALVDKVKKS